VGLDIGGEGSIKGVEWNSPAFRAGLTAGGKIIAINGLAYQNASDMFCIEVGPVFRGFGPGNAHAPGCGPQA
jgi:C-terminal processing protease CtpA/Prc